VLTIDRTALDALAIAGTATGVLGLAAAGLLGRRVRRIHRDFAVLGGEDGQRHTVIEAIDRQRRLVDQLRREVAAARTDLDGARAELSNAIRHVSVVRYDAFGDMGGRLSFSAALLDDAGDGLLITSINGRTESRSYAKGVKGGASDQMISPEEEQALALAFRGETEAGPPRVQPRS
jgi:hypothetical protein